MSIVLPINEDSRFRIITASAGQILLAITFPWQDDVDISVFKRVNGSWTQLSNPANYTLAGAGAAAGGSATLTAPALAGEQYLALGSAVLERVSSIVREGKFNSRNIDDELDRNRIIQQETARDLDRAIKAEYGQAGPTLASDVVDGDTLMKQGDRLVKGPNAIDIGNAQTNAAIATQKAAEAAASAAAAEATATAIRNNNFFVKEYGYVGDGNNHPLSEYFPSLALAQMAYPFATGLAQSIDWAAAQKAIKALEATITNGSFGGGTVVFPAGKGVISDGLVITKSFVHLVGAGRQATLLSFRHATQDCIKVFSGTGNIRCQSIRDMFIEAPNSTAGYAIWAEDTYNFLIDRVMIEGVFNGVRIKTPSNSTTVRDTLIMPTRPGAQYGIHWDAPVATGTPRGDVLYLNNVTMEGLWGNQTGLYWVGMTNTLVASSLRILHMNFGAVVEQGGASGSWYPSFLNAFDLEFEGFKTRALWIKDGAGFKISDSDINNLSGGDPLQGNADEEAIRVEPDVGESYTRSLQFVNTRIGGCRKNGLWIDCRDVLLSNIQFYTTGIGTANTYAAIRVGPNALNVHMVNVRGEEFGGAALVKAVVEVASGAQRVSLTNIDGSYCQTASVINNAGDDNVSEVNCIEPNGTIRSRVPGSFTVGTGNAKAEGGIALFRKDQAAVTDVRLGNNSTDGAARIRKTMYTGVANAYHIEDVNNNAGTPTHHESVGSGVTGGMRRDAPKHTFNNAGGTLQAEISDNGVQLKSFTVAGLPVGAAIGSVAWASNGRKAGEGAGAGTGVLVFKDGAGWKACDTGAAAAA